MAVQTLQMVLVWGEVSKGVFIRRTSGFLYILKTIKEVYKLYFFAKFAKVLKGFEDSALVAIQKIVTKLILNRIWVDFLGEKLFGSTFFTAKIYLKRFIYYQRLGIGISLRETILTFPSRTWHYRNIFVSAA